MRFLTLNDFVLPPPFPAIVAILIVAAVAGISRSALRQLKPSPNASEQGAAFIVAFAALGAIAHALVLLHAATPAALRLLTALVVLSGCAALIATPPRVSSAIRPLLNFWRSASFLERAASLGIALTVLSLILAAAGPVTDPDSLDYHLGVPLDWLRHSGLTLQPHWLHARLTGLGEAINLLGLAAGTDGLGAAVQVAGLITLLVSLSSLGMSPRDKIFAMLLALPPAILPLAVAQKPQLLPAVAVVIALILAHAAESPVDFLLVFGCAAFAIASKYLFFVSGGIVFLAALFWAYRRGLFATASLCAAATLLFLVLPVLGRNYLMYGDPVSPFLETFRSHPNPEITQFAAFLRNAGGEHTLAGIRDFLIGIVVPHSLGDVQIVLGIGVLSVLLVTRTEWSLIALLGSTLVLLFTLWRGQMAPRDLLEPYLWCAVAAVAAPWSRMKSILFPFLAVQAFGVAALAVGTAATLFPGALTPALRDRVMRRSTFGYEESLWLDRVLPRDAVIVTDSRAYALLPRPFVIPACFSCGPASLLELIQHQDLRQFSGDVLVMNYPVEGVLTSGCALRTVSGPERFRYAVRNPFNSGQYEAIAAKVECK